MWRPDVYLIEHWARTPDSESSCEWANAGVVVLKRGRVIVLHQADPAVLVFAEDGSLETAWGDRFGAYGLTLVKQEDTSTCG